jgi:hypothetical protein
MIKDIYIYGTTVGFDITPIDDTAGYYECFYDGSKIEKKFIVSQSNNIVRYNYLRYNNIIGSGGRGNSFFGLCVVFENEYISKPYKLFQLFEYVFNKIVQNNKIFTLNNGNYKYKGSFKDISNDVEDLKITLKDAILLAFSNDIVRLTTNLNVPYHNKVRCFNYNKKDLDDTFINQSFLQNGRVEFSNKEEDEEIISIEQFFDFKKEAKKYSDYRKQFADTTSTIQNEWITNTNLNKNSFRKTISEAINTSVQQLNKIQPIVGLLTKNQKLGYVAELNKKYIENFNSINENREKLNSLLQIKEDTNLINTAKKPLVFEPEIQQQGNEIKQEDRKLFPVLSKYAKPILIVGCLSILGALGYYLYPKKEPFEPPIPKPESGNIITDKKDYGYSSNPTVDSIINLITISANENNGEKVISLLDNLKHNFGNSTNALQLKPSFTFQDLTAFRKQFSKKEIEEQIVAPTKTVKQPTKTVKQPTRAKEKTQLPKDFKGKE